jgi:hypothetical protein
VEGEPSAARRALFLAALVVAAPLALAIGLLLAVLALVGIAVAALAWLVRAAGAWCWYAATRWRRTDYPFRLRAPSRPFARRTVLRDARMHAVPAFADAGSRLVAFLLSPTALTISALGVVFPPLRARPYVRVFSPPRLVEKVVGLGERNGFLVDGRESIVRPYDEWLEVEFPEIPHFLAWWNSSGPAPYEPLDPPYVDRHAKAAGLARLELGAHPDPFGYPGLAMATIRRRSIRGLRELLISQSEIDDRGDPDLDDRADAGIIRIVSRIVAPGERMWIVQIPSTQSFDPRSGVAPNDITAGLVASSGRQPTLSRAALSAMAQAGIRRGEPVLISGFSLGGIIAAELAMSSIETGYRVTHVVTEGAPTGRARIPKGVRVLSFEHLLDAFPRLDGRRNPVGAWVTVSAGPPVPFTGPLGFAHHLPSYAETAGDVAADPPGDRVRDFVETSRDFFGAGQVVHDFAATRTGQTVARPFLPVHVRWAEEDGITSRTLRALLRRVVGVVAVDIFASHTGYPTSVQWNADILVERLEPWLRDVDRRIVYRGLIALLAQRRAAGIHLRVQARDEAGITWEATLQRAGDGRWHERVDLDYGDSAAEARSVGVLGRHDAGARVGFHPSTAFDVP